MVAQIKVCGITQLDDALMCEALGVDLLGFNFVESSPRYIEPLMADEIIAEISPDTVCVGVFQNPSQEEVSEAIDMSGIDMLQFHGSESPDFLAEFDIPCIKVFSVTDDFNPASLEPYMNVADYFLFDSQVGGQEGGTGVTFDWSKISGVVGDKPWFIAGGIGPDNIVEAVTTLNPQYVDINSQVEKSPGTKDISLVRECVELIEGLS